MNTRDLELFLHLSRTLHFGRTALDCNITPSGLTRAIQRLETEVQEDLFLRDNRSVSLTTTGKLLVEYASASVNSLQQFRNHLQGDRPLVGQICLYCSVTAIISILPRILKSFRTIYPEIALQVETGDPARSLARLLAGDVDISIAALPEHIPQSLDYIVLEETPLLFITPRFFPDVVARDDNGEIDWTRTPLILPGAGLSRIRAERWFAAKGVRPYIYADVGGNEAITPMVSIGLGVGIVPQLVLEKNTLKDEVEVMPMAPKLEPFAVSACTMSSRRSDEVIDAFWKIVEQTVENPEGVTI